MIQDRAEILPVDEQATRRKRRHGNSKGLGKFIRLPGDQKTRKSLRKALYYLLIILASFVLGYSFFGPAFSSSGG